MVIKFIKKHLKFILLSSILILIISYFGISFFIAENLTRPVKIPVPIEKEAIAENGEDIEFTAPDGVRLSGWFFQGTSQKTVIMVHGVGETRANMYYGGAPIAQFLLKNGYSVLMYDMRGNGESESTRFTLGLTEGKDIFGAIEFLNKKGIKNNQIAILADSLGAISTLMQLRSLDVGAIIVDSPAAVIEPIITREMTMSRNVPKFLVPGVYFMAKVVFNIDVNKVRPIDEVRDTDVLLIFHGTKDTFIDSSNSQEVFGKSSKESRLVLFENSEHVRSFFDHEEQFKKEILDFLKVRLN